MAQMQVGIFSQQSHVMQSTEIYSCKVLNQVSMCVWYKPHLISSADLVLLDDAFNVRATYISGEEVWRNVQ